MMSASSSKLAASKVLPSYMIENQNEFYSTAMDSGSLVAAGARGSIVFWDTRNKSNTRSFEESFNEEVTGLEFNKDKPMNLMGCGLDGIVSSFDLNQLNE
jgi:WD40 repeat protein